MENAELSVNGPVDWLPLFVFVPLHAPLATHVPEAVLAFEVHVKIDEPPTGIKDGFAWSRTAHTPPAIAVGVGLAIQLQSVSEVQALFRQTPATHILDVLPHWLLPVQGDWLQVRDPTFNVRLSLQLRLLLS
jgi:hypothetical protein